MFPEPTVFNKSGTRPHLAMSKQSVTELTMPLVVLLPRNLSKVQNGSQDAQRPVATTPRGTRPCSAVRQSRGEECDILCNKQTRAIEPY